RRHTRFSRDWSSDVCSSDLSNLAVGQHTFQVRAKDRAGNVDPTPASRTWTIVEPQREPEPEPGQPGDGDRQELAAGKATRASSTDRKSVGEGKGVGLRGSQT